MSARLGAVSRNCRPIAVFPFAAPLGAAALLLAACQTTPPPEPSLAGDPRDKVLETYGAPLARQHNGNVEVWQYCEAAEEAAEEEGAEAAAAVSAAGETGPTKDRLHLVWLIDGIVTGESHHEFALDGCRRRYVVDLDSPPVRG